ncbi:cation:proton antiporter [Occallatibacter riparius]|uniref:Sodium:proton antiporter n=1 Tax=Occallatibacter riparius TaxID=1002689 RepID=A0A9J7BWJ9_9BACT|nr:sodium:proton antiporter [Occallatibacter riparius]UWZ86186.1 sodium:proton antiporter [Occallatibacter riparius]
MRTLELVSLLVATAAVFGWLSVRVLRVPITIGTMLLTVIVSLVLANLGPLAPGVHSWAEQLANQIDFEDVILRGMLPLLLFAGAFLLDLDQLAREKLPVALLAVPGTVITFLSVAGLMKLLMGAHASWMECLIFGAVISPTDPVAVLEMLRRVGISKSIESQLAGESLFNDGIGAVLFLTMIAIARGAAPTAWSVGWLLLLQAGGAILLGIAAAWITSQLMCRVLSYQIDILLSLSLALGGYVLAANWRLSAPLEAVVAGLALRHFNRKQPQGRIADDRLDEFWTMTDEVQNSLLFVLLGLEVISVTLNPLSIRAGGSAIVAANLVRFAVVAVCALIIHLCQKQRRRAVFLMTWGGLRGGISIALALSIPPAIGGSWILGATYLVVVFSILVQGGSMHVMMTRRTRQDVAHV